MTSTWILTSASGHPTTLYYSPQGLDVGRGFIRGISPSDLLRIKRHLRAEYTGLFRDKPGKARRGWREGGQRWSAMLRGGLTFTRT